MSALSFAAAARLAVRRGDRPAAERQLGRAMRARPLCTFVLPHVAVRVRLQLGTVYVTLAEQPTARHLLAEIDDILAHRPDLGGLVDEVSALRARVSAQGAEGLGAGPPLTPAELRLLPYLQTQLTFGERLFLSRNTVATEVGSIYRKPGCVLPQCCGRTGDDGGAARRVSSSTADGFSTRQEA